MFYISDRYVEELIHEDLQHMDLTTMAMGIEELPGRVECFPKRECTLAGVEEAARIFEKCGAKTEIFLKSGRRAAAGEICLAASGTAGQLHGCYKLAQNVMEYSSGIATRTAAMLAAARAVNPKIHVAVTRKHFPGGKALSLKAALAGGASLHRLGLSDSILVFDQHRIFTEDFAALVPRMAAAFPEKKIEAEADCPEEAMRWLRAGVEMIQCERFSLEELAAFVKEAKPLNPRAVIAAAGGVNAENAAEFAAAGVDILVTSWVYFGKPEDIKMKFSRA
ncbi:MAG: ModD protein [Synergistaceae bacterium]|nr:ModD protein [Synergistaceae bacterium]